jgi:hypothetical protein
MSESALGQAAQWKMLLLVELVTMAKIQSVLNWQPVIHIGKNEQQPHVNDLQYE